MWPLGGEWGALNECSVVKWGKAPCRERKSDIFCLSLQFHWTFSTWSKFVGFATELCHLLRISGRGWQGLKAEIWDHVGNYGQSRIPAPCSTEITLDVGFSRWDGASGSLQSNPLSKASPTRDSEQVFQAFVLNLQGWGSHHFLWPLFHCSFVLVVNFIPLYPIKSSWSSPGSGINSHSPLASPGFVRHPWRLKEDPIHVPGTD